MRDQLALVDERICYYSKIVRALIEIFQKCYEFAHRVVLQLRKSKIVIYQHCEYYVDR